MRRFVAALLLAGCAGGGDLARVSGGGPIPSPAVALALDAQGVLRVDGRPAGIEAVRSLRRAGVERDLEPVLLELHPSLAFRRCRELLIAVLGDAAKRNVAFRVETAAGPAAVSLPLVERHLCRCLTFQDGAARYDEHGKPGRESDHLWIRMRVGPAGVPWAVSLDVGIHEMEIADPTDPNPPDVRELRRWKGAHPPLGAWPLQTLREFLADPEIASRSPFVDLEIGPDDTVQEALSCLTSIRSAIGGRVVVGLRIPPE